MNPAVLIVALLTAASLAQPAAALTVRVDSAGEAPRTLVEGKPVRARMFWGAPGARPVYFAEGAHQLSLEFVAVADEPTNATMHFRFGDTPGEVRLDDIRVTDLDTGQDAVPACTFDRGETDFTRDWAFWPTGEQNTVGTVAVTPGAGRDGSGGLRVTLKAPADGKWPDFHLYHQPNLALVGGHRYRIQLWAFAEPARDVRIHFTRPGIWDTLGAPGDVFASQLRLAAEVGVDFVSFPCPLPWPAPDQPVNWSAADAACAAVLAANPRALLLPRIGMDPPDWWRRAHPDHVMGWEPGTDPASLLYGAANGAVVASLVYRRDAAERLAALVAHLEERFRDHLAGYHPSGQHTDEWFYHNSWGSALSGYAPADTAAWRTWLRARYGSNDVLQEAWGDPAATCDTAEVPSPAARRAAPAGVFRDPVAERPLIDFAEHRQEAMDEELLQHPTAFHPQVAAVVDERSMLRMAAGSAVVGRPGLYEARAPLGHLGAPCGQYLGDDVVAGRVSAKLSVFLTEFCLSAAERTALLKAPAGSTRLWCYAPGYHDDYRVSPEAMQELTGFTLAPVSPGKAWATPTEVGRKLGLRQAFGVDGPVRPLFAAADAQPEEVLATYPDGSPAVARRDSADGASLFVGVPGLTSELLRLAARHAGVHLFTQTDCNVYANGPFVAVHAAQNGPLELDLGRTGAVRDVLSGETVGQGPRVVLTLQRGDTRVLRY